MVQEKNKSLLLHACCGICSGYPISMLKDLGYAITVYFSNSNLDTENEFDRRFEAQKQICDHFGIILIKDNYNHDEYLEVVKGLENEPERGNRCDKCIEYRLTKAAKKTKELNIGIYTTSLVISPHKNYEKISSLGKQIAEQYNLEYLDINFRKNDGFLKTNQISKELAIYRQNYCGCEFAKSHIDKKINN